MFVPFHTCFKTVLLNEYMLCSFKVFDQDYMLSWMLTGEDATKGEERCFMMYRYPVVEGHMFPLFTNFDIKILNYQNVCPAMLKSNSWMLLSGFQLLCYNLGVVPPRSHSSIFRMQRSLSVKLCFICKVAWSLMIIRSSSMDYGTRLRVEEGVLPSIAKGKCFSVLVV